MAQAFQGTYQQYLTALGQATRQQLILASYHICTRGYPEQFTLLSSPERQTLQRTLRQLAQQAETELIGCLAPITSTKPSWALLPGQKNPFDLELELDEAGQQPDRFDSDPEQASSAPASPSNQSFELDQTETEPENSEPDGASESDQPDSAAPATETDNALLPNISLLSETLTAGLGSPAPSSSAPPETDRPLHPKQIAQWQSQLEAEVVEVLQTISHATNQVLQQTGILPNRLPEPILEVAAKADLSSETTASPPNLLNLLVEADIEDEKSTLTQVMALRLRLPEIEFGDAATAAQRSKLRQLTAQLVKLGREYQRKQKERAIAAAEAAWRSSWYEREE